MSPAPPPSSRRCSARRGTGADVHHADIAFLFGYDRWATRRILGVIDGVDEATWGAIGIVGDRGL